MLAQKSGVKSILMVTARRFDSDFSMRVLEKKDFACFRLVLLEIDLRPPSLLTVNTFPSIVMNSIDHPEFDIFDKLTEFLASLKRWL